MSVKIHHGPPGSYKTSGAVQDDFLPAVKAGRTIVTNVRGISRERVIEAMPDIPESLEIISIDTDTAEGRERFAKWFHWAPIGALIFVDEAQSVFPKRWGKAEVEALDFPGGVDAATAAGRPHDWATAWEKHRHYNWDVILTTPSIKLLRSDVRECAEMAYKHKNMAGIGVRGRYLEAPHPADSNGSRSDFIGEPKMRRIQKDVWKLYDSTATGNHQDTIVGAALWKDPKLLLALGVLTASVVYGIYSWPDSGLFASGSQARPEKPSTARHRAPDSSRPASAGLADGGNAPDGASREVPRGDRVIHPLFGARIVYDGEISLGRIHTLVFRVYPADGGPWIIRAHELETVGYAVRRLGPCIAELSFGGWREWAICAPEVETDRQRGKPLALGLMGE